MQDEINERTVALYIKTGKLTAAMLQQAMKALLKEGKGQLNKAPHGEMRKTSSHIWIRSLRTISS